MYWLTSFKSGNLDDIDYRRRVIDTLLNSVYVFDNPDGGRKLVFTFNLSGQNTSTIECSDIKCSSPPKGSNPNSLFFIKHTFGFVVIVEEVG